MESLIIAIVAGALALAFAAVRVRDVLAEDEGTDEMRSIAKSIQEGAAAFLRREYTFLGWVCAGDGRHPRHLRGLRRAG